MKITVLDKHGSAWREPEERPRTVEALAHFDPNVKLVYNRAHGLFQLVRPTRVAWHYHVAGFGDLCHIDTILVWEMDCRDPAEKETWDVEIRDDPTDLLLRLIALDTWESPHLKDSDWALYNIEEQRRKLEEKVSDMHRHNYKYNRRQILRLWEPFADGTF